MTNNNSPSISQLKTVLVFLQGIIQTLETRADIQVTASTDSDADYAAEVVDGRVDIWGNAQGSLGANIRDGQTRLSLGLQYVKQSHQEQIDALAESVKGLTVTLSETLDKRRLETVNEQASRIERDEFLQSQIDTLSFAMLELCVLISDTRDLLRTKQEA